MQLNDKKTPKTSTPVQPAQTTQAYMGFFEKKKKKKN